MNRTRGADPSACVGGWISPSGGLAYHWRALRHRDRLWRPFRRTVAGWLADWAPPCRRLVLIGPSAGHTLPVGWLGGFAEVEAYEPDPLARWWLARRARHPALRFSPLDVLATDPPLAPLAKPDRQTAILFCNVLGQCPPPGGGRWHRHLASALAGRHWASFHDLVSTDRPPRSQAAPCRVDDGRLEAVLARFWDGGELVLTDHDTFRLGGRGPADYALWPLERNRFHLIEWVRHAPARDSAQARSGIGHEKRVSPP